MNSGRKEREEVTRGLSIFDLSFLGGGNGTNSKISGGKENVPRSSSNLHIHAGTSNIGDKRDERLALKPSQIKNRKKKAIEMGDMDEDRPVKRQVLGEISTLIMVPVKAAQQSHREL